MNYCIEEPLDVNDENIDSRETLCPRSIVGRYGREANDDPVSMHNTCTYLCESVRFGFVVCMHVC